MKPRAQTRGFMIAEPPFAYLTTIVPFMFVWTSQRKSYVPAATAELPRSR